MAGLATAMAAADSDPADANPYSVISDRNIFHLNPPPPAPEAEDVKPAELRKLMLTGIVKKHDTIKAWLAIPPKDNKETVIYMTLAPGEKQHDVELVKIRYDKEEVDVINAGTPQTLSVKSNSYASTAAPAPHGGGAPAIPGGMPGIGHRPGFPGRNALPTPPTGPGAAMTPRGGSAIIAGGGSGSAIIGGGGAGNAGSPFGASSGGAIVSGGSPYVPTGAPGPANTAGEQIATSLFNQQNGRYQPPTPTAPPAPPMVQATGMLAQKMNMGGAAPPLPPPLQSMLEEGNSGQPPAGSPGIP
jgi:hypothetical protein